MTDTHTPRDATIPVVPRPALDRWLRDRDIDDAAFADMVKPCTRQFVNRMRKPFDDEDRARPGPKLLTRIIRVTRGEVRPEDFSPPVAEILRGMAA